MARKPKTAAPAAGNTGLVMTVNKIVYGKGKMAPANSPFFPASAKQRAELFKLGAVREPTEAEAALFGDSAPAPAEEAPPPLVEDPSADPPADQDPLG